MGLALPAEWAAPQREWAYYARTLEGWDAIPGHCSRLYFGQEFCERLLPEERDLRTALARARRMGLPLSLVTPFVTNWGLSRVRPLLAIMSEDANRAEMVVNDWGVLRLARSFPGMEPVLGRLLNKVKRDPRLTRLMGQMSAAARHHFQATSCGTPHFRNFLRSFGIRRVEFENPLQGLEVSFGDAAAPGSSMHASLHYPYVCLTTSRICQMLSDATREPNVAECGRRCRQGGYYLQNADFPVELDLRGNSIFYRNDVLPATTTGGAIDRIIYSPEPPL